MVASGGIARSKAKKREREWDVGEDQGLSGGGLSVPQWWVRVCSGEVAGWAQYPGGLCVSWGRWWLRLGHAQKVMGQVGWRLAPLFRRELKLAS